jgi:excisionase family DNA binding protein
MTKLLKPNEVAVHLSVALATVRKWIHEGRLPVVRLGRAVRIREEDCDALPRSGGLRREGRTRAVPSTYLQKLT